MTLEEVQLLIEIAMRSASTVERRWIEGVVARVNAQNAAQAAPLQRVGPAVELPAPNGHTEPVAA